MSSISESYRPDETNAEIFSEHTWLQGAFLGSVGYGMAAILYFMSVNLLWKARKGANRSRNIGLMVYITIIFLLSTFYMVALLQFTQLSFIDDRNIPGGPNYYETAMYSIPIDLMGNAVMVIITWMCDIINVWRCSVIYKGSKLPVYVVLIIPSLMYLTSIVLGTLWLKQVGTSSSSPYSTSGINFTVPYYAMSLALNILVTILIVVRLLLYRAKINRAMGKKHGAQYTSLAAMMVESAAIYSAFSLLFLVPFSLTQPTAVSLSQLFLLALSPVQVFSTFLIIFRVAQGKSWSQDTAATLNGAAGATHTIGGTWRRNRINIQTNTVTFSDSTKNSMALQTMDKTGTAGNFDQLKAQGGSVDAI